MQTTRLAARVLIMYRAILSTQPQCVYVGSAVTVYVPQNEVVFVSCIGTAFHNCMAAPRLCWWQAALSDITSDHFTVMVVIMLSLTWGQSCGLDLALCNLVSSFIGLFRLCWGSFLCIFWFCVLCWLSWFSVKYQCSWLPGKIQFQDDMLWWEVC